MTPEQINAARGAIAQMRQCARDLATSHPNRAQLANICGEMVRRADELDAMLGAAEAADTAPAAVVHDTSCALMTQSRVVYDPYSAGAGPKACPWLEQGVDDSGESA